MILKILEIKKCHFSFNVKGVDDNVQKYSGGSNSHSRKVHTFPKICWKWDI